MRQVLKWTLAIAVCLLLLMPSAWGRSKDYMEAHPNGDGTGLGDIASAPPETLIVGWQTVGTVLIPIMIAIPAVSAEASESSGGTITTQDSVSGDDPR